MKLVKMDLPANTGNGGGKFLKIEIGQSVSGVFRGEPITFYQRWPRGGNKEVSQEPKPGFDPRFKVNFVVYEDGKFVAKIFDFNVAVYNQMADINEAYDLESIKCRIGRVAAGKGSHYMVLPLIKEAIPPKALKDIEAVELHSLGEQAPTPGTGEFGSEIPF